MRRSFGWIQDGGSFDHLKRVVQSIYPNSALNLKLRNELIPIYVPERFGRNDLIACITGENCDTVPYDLLKGSGSSNQLTVHENMTMFGYNREQAEAIVRGDGRGNAACSGVAQLATPAQKLLPNGRNKPYQGDWQAECFIRWAVSLGFIAYNSGNDTCKVSELGKRFADTPSGSNEENTIIGEALLSYPPACRVLTLLSEQGHLTKFEIGRQLGFIGEAGFTSVSQALYVGGISTAPTLQERTKIRQNFEGSSDKYARMIAGWLIRIGWVSRVPKNVTETYLGNHYTLEIGQSYMITQRGQSNINRIRGGTRHGRSAKRVLWNMLATAAPDADYLRNRRYHTIQAIKTSRKSLEQIKAFLCEKGFDVNIATIEDDIANFESIGLQVDSNTSGYLLKDDVLSLELPTDATAVTQRADLSVIKDRLREELRSVDHRYLVLLDLSYNNSSGREFELETMSLLTEELDYQGLHLGGARRPDGLFYKDEKGVIVDTKAYSRGYNLPIPQADEMIRYIEENKNRGTLNPNVWWENFDDRVNSFSYLFVSSEFKGHFKENIRYIKDRTDYDGGAITATNLLRFADRVHSGALSYEDSFRILRNNDEVLLAPTPN